MRTQRPRSPAAAAWACRLPGLRCDEGVEFDVSGEVVDEAAQSGEGALQQDLADRLGGQPGLRRSGERRVADLAPVQCYLPGQRRGGGGGPAGRRGALAQQLDLLL